MFRAMFTAARELREWVHEHRWALFLTTIAAYAQQHYDLYGPPAHLLVLPGLAVVTFLVFPLWGAVVHDSRDRVALLVSAVGAALAMAPALVWAYADGGREALKADPDFLVVGGALGLALVLFSAVRGGVSLSAWGLGKGDFAWWSRPVGVLLVLILVCIPIVAWIFPEFVAFYPRYKPGRTALLPLVQYQIAMALYMFCWEFFFRGYMLFGLARSIGPFAAILVQCYPFFILHHQKPEPEMASSWFGGLLMGWLCWRAGCMWPSFLLHSVLYTTMEVTAYVYRNGF